MHNFLYHEAKPTKNKKVECKFEVNISKKIYRYELNLISIKVLQRFIKTTYIRSGDT